MQGLYECGECAQNSSSRARSSDTAKRGLFKFVRSSLIASFLFFSRHPTANAPLNIPHDFSRGNEGDRAGFNDYLMCKLVPCFFVKALELSYQ